MHQKGFTNSLVIGIIALEVLVLSFTPATKCQKLKGKSQKL
jgi:hypothetical protein